jgi:hypothetical protein
MTMDNPPTWLGTLKRRLFDLCPALVQLTVGLVGLAIVGRRGRQQL